MMNYHRFMELLKGMEDSKFNDHKVFANAHWLSCGSGLQRLTIPLTPIQRFLLRKGVFAKYSIIKGKLNL